MKLTLALLMALSALPSRAALFPTSTPLSITGADARYLRKDAAAGTQSVASAAEISWTSSLQTYTRRSLFSATGVLVDNVTQDAMSFIPSGPLSTFYRAWAAYDPAGTTPATWVGPPVTFGGIAYRHGSLRMLRDGKSLLMGKETSGSFFDIASDIDVDLFCNADGSFVDVGPLYGATLNEGVSGAFVRATSAGNFHLVAGLGNTSALNGGPTYSGVQLNGSTNVNIVAGLGAAEMKEDTFDSNLSAYSNGQVSVVARGSFVQIESTAGFALLKGTETRIDSTAGDIRTAPSTGFIRPDNDNSTDVGKVGNRYRTVRAGTSVVVGASTTYGDGTITTTGGGGVTVDGNATKSRSSYGPWTMVNLAASQTDATMDLPTSTILPAGQARFRMPFNGRIKAISVSGSAARTAGTATFVVFKNNASVVGTPSVVIDGTNTQRNYNSSGTATFVAGDDIDVRFTTNVGWSPVNAEWAVFVVVEWTQ